MATPQGCPCDAVTELKEVVRDVKIVVQTHDTRLSEGETSFALISKDLEYIKKAVDNKQRFNTNILASVIQGIVAILLGYITVRMGLQ